MANEFKFEKYAYEPDPDFDELEFIKFENLKNKVITITDNIRINEDKSSVKMEIIMDGEHYCTFTKAKAIVRTLSNIMDDIGTVPNVPVMIGTYSTNNGKDGYCFKDVTE